MSDLDRMKSRVRIQFPAVLLTLISIIQALALELLWSKTTGSEFLFEPSLAAAVGWLSVLAVFFGILQIWLMYTTLVMGFEWQPLLRDSIFPFIIGVQEFMLVELISEGFNPLWLVILASIFISANYITHVSYRRARAEEANAFFFAGVEPATWRDFILVAFIILVLLAFAAAIALVPGAGSLPLWALVFVLIILAVQLEFARRLWRAVIGEAESRAKD